MFERFTESARHAVAVAQEEARGLDSGHIGTEHLLLALTRESAGPAGRALRRVDLTADVLRDDIRRHGRPGGLDADALAVLGIDLDEVRRRVEASFGPGALDRRRGRCASGHIPFTPNSKKSLELALRQALSRGDKSIGTQHLLLGVLQSEDEPSVALLRRRSRSAEEVRAALLDELEPGSATG